MAHVIGLNFAMKLIQAGMAVNGTSAELKNIIGSERKPSTEKKSPWLLTENAMAIEIAVYPTPNIMPIIKIAAMPSNPVAGCTPKRNATPKMTSTCREVIVMTKMNRLKITDVR